ncbi:DUF924 family protein [Brevundimonas sp.]|uniref:DUF924 family protein n=1 Tax=Brevundimonas sp. TaxID=1871086 RepID=UPI001A30210D|nr:DUF924 family protein [Brevundimonas sp.]MBJ7484283.1 DUF924 family protein [Brevundimonas sp.]
MTVLITPSSVVAFWKEAGPRKWYAKDEAFDREFRDAGRALHWAAARRELDDWIETAEGALALMILLDQYPRNSFRGTAHQFATDGLGLMFARQAWDRGWPQTFDPDVRQFFVTPFEHSEDLADQDTAVALSVDMPEVLKFAHMHRDIIVRFGRFPHRNRALGRETTAEEQAFLDGGGFGG